MNKLIIILFVSLLFACSPQKRLNRLLKNHPELKTIDTISVIDTFITKEITSDTIFISKPIDTLIINKDKFIIEVIRHYDTLFVHGEVKKDTIIKEIKIPVEKIIVTEKDNHTLIIIIVSLSILLLLLIYFISLILKKKE